MGVRPDCVKKTGHCFVLLAVSSKRQALPLRFLGFQEVYQIGQRGYKKKTVRDWCDERSYNVL
jgi:hypothetical protein